MKRYLNILPEVFLILILVLASYTPPFSFSPLFLIPALVVLVQMLVKNRILGVLIASVYVLANVFFLVAMLSEFSEFATITGNARNLILFGSTMFVVNLMASLSMLFKYTGMSNPLLGYCFGFSE